MLSEIDKSFAREVYPFDDLPPHGLQCAGECSSPGAYVEQHSPQPVADHDQMYARPDQSRSSTGYIDGDGADSGAYEYQSTLQGNESEEDVGDTVRYETTGYFEEVISVAESER